MEQLNKLADLYKKGETSLKEEQLLRARFGDTVSGEMAWFSFAGKMEKKAPGQLQENVLSAVNSLRQRRRRIIVMISSAAALAVLLISVLVLNPGKTAVMEYNNKMAILEEAINLTQAGDAYYSEDEVIYEDDIIIIYLK